MYTYTNTHRCIRAQEPSCRLLASTQTVPFTQTVPIPDTVAKPENKWTIKWGDGESRNSLFPTFDDLTCT